MPKGGKRAGAGRPKGQGKYGEKTCPMRVPERLVEDIKGFIANQGESLPLYSCAVSAGFPSPAEDYLEGMLDLNSFLVKHPAATFFVRVSGDSMIEAGIFEDDILVVDRSLTPKSGKIVIAALESQLTVKRLLHSDEGVFLCPENKNYDNIKVENPDELVIWGVVTTVLHRV